MQSQFQRGLNMLAISNPKRTIYACNLFQKGPNMLANCVLHIYYRLLEFSINKQFIVNDTIKMMVMRRPS